MQAALPRDAKFVDRIVEQAHLLVGDSQVIVGLDILRSHYLFQALLELRKHVLNRVLEVCGPHFLSERINLRLVRFTQRSEKRFRFRVPRIGNDDRLEDLPRFFHQPLLNEKSRFRQLFGRRRILGPIFQRDLFEALFHVLTESQRLLFDDLFRGLIEGLRLRCRRLIGQQIHWQLRRLKQRFIPSRSRLLLAFVRDRLDFLRRLDAPQRKILDRFLFGQTRPVSLGIRVLGFDQDFRVR